MMDAHPKCRCIEPLQGRQKHNSLIYNHPIILEFKKSLKNHYQVMNTTMKRNPGSAATYCVINNNNCYHLTGIEK